MQHRATLARVLALAACVLAAFAAPAQAERMTRQRIASDDEPKAGGTPAQTSPWQGGPSSLPYNTEGLSEQRLRDHALTMAGVVEAMNSFQARGYLRRADLDTFYVGVGFSGLVLGYEKPGVPVMERQPVIVVHSQAISFASEGWLPATTIGGFMARDSTINDTLSVPVIDRDPADAPMLVYQRLAATPGSLGSPISGEDMAPWFAYSMKEGYELAQTIRQYLPTQSAEAAQW